MKRYLAYLKYILRHKWFVFRGALKVNPCSIRLLYRAIMHDMSKFIPSEFIPYAKTFYKPDGSKQYVETDAFNMAWNHHQKRNKHHHQYWVLREDSGKVYALEMPDIYIQEMIADWIGAGWAIHGKWSGVFKWYKENKDKMILHEVTRHAVETYLDDIASTPL